MDRRGLRHHHLLLLHCHPPHHTTSNGQARRTLAAASADRRPFWAACHVPVEHPEWWPGGRGAAAVPGFEHLIVGEGRSGIGMHRDRYAAYLPHHPTASRHLTPPPSPARSYRAPGQAERLVSTYLALGRGRKHVVLLPPTEEGARLAEVGGMATHGDLLRPLVHGHPPHHRPPPPITSPPPPAPFPWQELGGAGCDSAYGRATSQRVDFPLRRALAPGLHCISTPCSYPLFISPSGPRRSCWRR